MINKLNPREMNHLGLTGTRGTDWSQLGNVLELALSGAETSESLLPATAISVAYPGETFLLWTEAGLSLRNTIALADVHPSLSQAGFCSFTHVLTDDFAGRPTVLFRCEREINLAELPYLLKVVSLGTLKQ